MNKRKRLTLFSKQSPTTEWKEGAGGTQCKERKREIVVDKDPLREKSCRERDTQRGLQRLGLATTAGREGERCDGNAATGTASTTRGEGASREKREREEGGISHKAERRRRSCCRRQREAGGDDAATPMVVDWSAWHNARGRRGLYA